MSIYDIIVIFVKKRFELSVWAAVYFVAAFIAVMVQFVALPYIFPAWHAGNGLLVGGDWRLFHFLAVEMAENIRAFGWSAWELHPRGLLPAGVAGAVYALTGPKPWVLIPLNAAIHATTVLFVIRILQYIVPSKMASLIAALPFALFPSAMLWYTQIHRDGYHFLGVMLFLYGLLLILIPIKESSLPIKQLGKGLLISLGGVLLIWLVRAYFIAILQYVFALIILLVVIVFIYQYFIDKAYWKSYLLKLISLVIIFTVMLPLTQTDWASRYQYDAGDVPTIGEAVDEDIDRDRFVYYWERIDWLPESIDNRLYSMAYFKAVEYPRIFGEPASAIDYDRTLHNGYDFIFYLPRALQIAFLAPFPNMWLEAGSGGETTMFRRIAMLEMIIVYLVLPFMLIGIWKWKKRLEVWILFIFCTVIMLPLVYAMPNVGAVYRYRYGYLMLVMGMGVAFIVKQFRMRAVSGKKVE